MTSKPQDVTYCCIASTWNVRLSRSPDQYAQEQLLGSDPSATLFYWYRQRQVKLARRSNKLNLNLVLSYYFYELSTQIEKRLDYSCSVVIVLVPTSNLE